MSGTLSQGVLAEQSVKHFVPCRSAVTVIPGFLQATGSRLCCLAWSKGLAGRLLQCPLYYFHITVWAFPCRCSLASRRASRYALLHE